MALMRQVHRGQRHLVDVVSTTDQEVGGGWVSWLAVSYTHTHTHIIVNATTDPSPHLHPCTHTRMFPHLLPAGSRPEPASSSH